MANLDPLQAYNFVRQQGEGGKQAGVQQLQGQAFNAPQDQRAAIYGQIARTDPNAALQTEQAMQGRTDAGLKRLAGFVRYVDQARAQAKTTGDMRFVNAALQQGSPFIAEVLGKPGPTEWTPDMEPGWEALKSQIAMAEGGAGASVPAGYQQFELTARAAGLQPGTPEYQQAARIALGQEGRASNAGFGFFEFEGADGRKRMGRNNPRTGARELYDEATGEFAPIGGQPGASAGASYGGPMGSPLGAPEVQNQLASLGDQFGFQTTSVGRTPAQNTAANGVPNSQHLTGTARDFSIRGKTPEQVETFANTLRQQGYEVIQHDAGSGMHLHAELPPNRAGAPGGITVGRRPEDEAAATAAAKGAAELALLPEQERIKRESAIEQAGGVEEAKQAAQTRIELALALPKVLADSQTAIQLIDKAISHPGRSAGTGASSKADPRNYLPGTDATDFRVLLDQLKGGTFLQAFQSLKGGGAITQVEGTKAEQAIARLDQAQSDEEFLVALQELRDIAAGAPIKAQAKLEALSQAATSPPQTGGYQPGAVIEANGKRYRVTGGDPNDPDVEEIL